MTAVKASQIALIALGLAEDYLGSYRASLRWALSLGNPSYSSNKSYWYVSDKFRQKGWLKNTQTDLQLLQKGREELLRQFPLLEWRKLPWDGKWRVVMYDLPEKIKSKRDLLRTWLQKLGFGQWQMSVWVSPHPVISQISQILIQTGLDQYCSVHESKRVIGKKDQDFANDIWKLEQINEQYLEILKRPILPEYRKRLFEMLMEDPMLPKELLPSNWRWDLLMKKITLNTTSDRLS